jgi:hypothetical protein
LIENNCMNQEEILQIIDKIKDISNNEPQPQDLIKFDISEGMFDSSQKKSELNEGYSQYLKIVE